MQQDSLKNTLRRALFGATADKGEDWFESLSFRHAAGSLEVFFPHAYFRGWFMQHKKNAFETALGLCFPDMLPGLVYSDKNPHSSMDGAPTEKTGAGFPAHEGYSIDSSEHSPRKRETLDSFICNAKNAFPLAALRKIAETDPGQAYNPVLLCGRSGTGKSHLLHALADALSDRIGSKAVCCEDTQNFCIANPALERDPRLFWNRRRALLLDDVQQAADKPAMQKMLTGLIDACPSNGQLVFTHGGRAEDMKRLGERLLTRLEGGLVVDLLEPDMEIRLNYLQTLCKKHGIALEKDQLLYLAQRCVHFRPMQGLMLKIAAFAAISDRALTQADLENIMRSGGIKRPLDCRDIMNRVAQRMNVTASDILGTRRRTDFVLARQLAMYVCRRKLGLSYPELGRAFGGKDHSTVIYSIRKIENMLLTDQDINQLVKQLEMESFS
ncbi:MAG: chromosomal replication initiator DnaA [Desulfovibrio sp.]|nr:chromosomal replication initiator DnaA [Desulfovibrio sp.]